MTDLERFKELYVSVGIPLEESKEGDYQILILEAKTHPKVTGYFGFHTWIFFNAEGMFVEQGFWE